MIILDTSVWIEFFRGKAPYRSEVSDLLGKGQALGLPWIFGELLQGAADKNEVDYLKSFWKVIAKPETGTSERAWIDAGIESQKGKWFSRGIGLIDAAIVCAAIELKCPVWTLDKKLKEVLRFKRLLSESV